MATHLSISGRRPCCLRCSTSLSRQVWYSTLKSRQKLKEPVDILGIINQCDIHLSLLLVYYENTIFYIGMAKIGYTTAVPFPESSWARIIGSVTIALWYASDITMRSYRNAHIDNHFRLRAARCTRLMHRLPPRWPSMAACRCRTSKPMLTLKPVTLLSSYSCFFTIRYQYRSRASPNTSEVNDLYNKKRHTVQ